MRCEQYIAYSYCAIWNGETVTVSVYSLFYIQQNTDLRGKTDEVSVFIFTTENQHMALPRFVCSLLYEATFFLYSVADAVVK